MIIFWSAKCLGENFRTLKKKRDFFCQFKGIKYLCIWNGEKSVSDDARGHQFVVCFSFKLKRHRKCYTLREQLPYKRFENGTWIWWLHLVYGESFSGVCQTWCVVHPTFLQIIKYAILWIVTYLTVIVNINKTINSIYRNQLKTFVSEKTIVLNKQHKNVNGNK